MDRRRFITMLGGTMAAATAFRAAAQVRPSGIDVVREFGFVPDGRTDNYEAFHRWAAHVNRNRGGSYVVRRHRTQSLAKRDPRTVINPLIDRADGLSISGYGARILLNGAFHRSSRRGRSGQAEGRDFAIFMPFEIHRSRNVAIRGFEIDGGVRAMTRDKDLNEAYAFPIALHGCRNVTLEDLNLHHGQTDGLYLTSSELGGRPGIACRDVTLRRVSCRNNARGGLGVIQVYGLVAEDCTFSDNGEGLGRYAPHAPRFGVDVEPDYYKPADVDTRTGNLEFRRCRFDGNASAFLAAYIHTYQGYLRLIDCRSSNATGGEHHMIVSWAGALIEGGVHDAGRGVVALSWAGQKGGSATLRNCEVRTSGLYGILHAYPGNMVALEGVKVIGAHRGPGTHGSVVALQSDPGGGRRNRMRGCEVYIPAARKARDHAYDYEVTLNYAVSENNLFRTDLGAGGGQHFAVQYGPGTVVRGDSFRGSFRPGHNSPHDLRSPFSRG